MQRIRNVDTKWFHRQFEDKGLSQRQAAKLLGLTSAALSLAMNGKRGILIEEAANLSLLLNVPVETVLARAGAYGKKVDKKAG